MELKNIFKMELYKNRNDVPYLRIIAILTAIAAITTVLGIISIENQSFMSNGAMLILFTVFTVIGLAIFSLLYPFHLLNVDYKNRVMSLIFASGVPREKYYFVKIGATILTCLIATFVILFIPFVTFSIVYTDEFVKGVQSMIEQFKSSDIIAFVLAAIFKLIATLVMLTTAVIITKGKTVGIFLYIGFVFLVSTIQTSFGFDFFDDNVSGKFYLDTIFSIVKIVVFALIGLQVLKKQDL